MGFFNKIFGGGGNEGKKETSADRILRVIKEKTTTECVTLIPSKGTTKPWESKIGGMPYMPKGFDYPYEEAGSTVVTEGQAPAVAASVAAGPFAGLDGGTTTVPSAAAGEALEQVEGEFQRDAAVGWFFDKGNSPVLYCGRKCPRVEFRESGRAEGIPGDLSRGSSGR